MCWPLSYILPTAPQVALYETGARHTHADIANTNTVNPTAILLASANMLRHLGFKYHAQSINTALHNVYASSDLRTPDLGGSASTTAFTAAVVKALADPASLAAA